MRLIYASQLTHEQRQYLEKFMSSGTSPARMLTRGKILLRSDQGESGPHWSYEKIAEAYDPDANKEISRTDKVIPYHEWCSGKDISVYENELITRNLPMEIFTQ